MGKVCCWASKKDFDYVVLVVKEPKVAKLWTFDAFYLNEVH